MKALGILKKIKRLYLGDWTRDEIRKNSIVSSNFRSVGMNELAKLNDNAEWNFWYRPYSKMVKRIRKFFLIAVCITIQIVMAIVVLGFPFRG